MTRRMPTHPAALFIFAGTFYTIALVVILLLGA